MASSLLNVKTLRGLKYLHWRSYLGRLITREELEHVLDLRDALWMHEGEPRASQPHALLASLQHSDGYINLGSVLKEYRGFRRVLADNLIRSLAQVGYDTDDINAVVGSDTSATGLAGDVAEQLGVYHIVMRKTPDGKQVLVPDQKIPPNLVILQVEELITTLKSSRAVREGIGRNCDYAPYLPVVIDRSFPRQERLGGSLILSLFRYEIRNYNPGTDQLIDQSTSCPFCAAGSKAIAPKANWERLLGRVPVCPFCGRRHDGCCPIEGDGWGGLLGRPRMRAAAPNISLTEKDLSDII